MFKKLLALVIAVVFLFTTSVADAADKGALVLKVNGADVKGENPVNSRQDTIEILSWELGVTTPRDPAGGLARAGARSYDVIRMVKPIDRSTPLLAKALVENAQVDATFKFYKASQTTGASENYYTVTIAKARIVAIKQMPVPEPGHERELFRQTQPHGRQPRHGGDLLLLHERHVHLCERKRDLLGLGERQVLITYREARQCRTAVRRSCSPRSLSSRPSLPPRLSQGDDAPPSIKLKPGVLPPAVSAMGILEPKIQYPASGVAYEQGSNPFAKVYIAWDYDGDMSKVHGWEICFYKEGTSCGPLSDWHFSKNASQRKASLTIPIMANSLKWRWKVGRKPPAGQGETDWAPERSVTVYPKMDLLELQTPADNATVTVPGTLSFTWKDVPGAEFYLFCNQKTPGVNGWQCADYPQAIGDTLFVAKTEKAAFVKAYSTMAEMYELLAYAPTAARKWGVSACRVVQEQSDVDGGQPPVPATHCKRSEMRRVVVNKTP